MKKFFVALLSVCLFSGVNVFSEDLITNAVENEKSEPVSEVLDDVPSSDSIVIENIEENEKVSKTKPAIDYLAEGYKFEPVEIPAAKRPSKVDEEKLEKAKNKDENGESYKENERIIKYGTSSEIGGVVNKIIEDEDPRFNDVLYDLFQTSKNQDIQVKILDFFSKQKDPCLSDYAITILNDPFDQPNKVVESAFQYVAETECKEAAPCVVEILESGNEDYFNAAIVTMGKIGGANEALYMASYLERDDLKTPQRQSLMRTLGQMCAIETWDKLVEIVKDEDENAFVRMYAAEAIGKMKKEESIPILIEFFQNGDPNMRQYCIKGLMNYPENEKARAVITQAIRDDYYKVRIEAIKAAKELDMKEAIPYLIYRADKDAEKVVQKECYPVIAKLDTTEGNEFLIKQITEKKIPDRVRVMAATSLMDNGTKGEKEIIELAKEALKDEKRKNLRDELGKLFIKHLRPSYSEICALYIQAEKQTPVSQGLEMFKLGHYETARPCVQKVADEGKNSTNRKQARKILGISDEDEDKDSKSEKTGSELKSDKSDKKSEKESIGEAK